MSGKVGDTARQVGTDSLSQDNGAWEEQVER